MYFIKNILLLTLMINELFKYKEITIFFIHAYKYSHKLKEFLIALSFYVRICKTNNKLQMWHLLKIIL